MAEKPRLKLPKEAKKGEVIEIKTLLPHIMESGQRKDKDGKAIPRKIINKFVCEFNGKPVFTANLEPAIAANPYMQFYAKVGFAAIAGRSEEHTSELQSHSDLVCRLLLV